VQSPPPTRVFLSHSHFDKHLVEAFANQFPQWLEVWLDEAELKPGEPLEQRVQSAIQEGVSFVLVFVSETAARSDWVKREVEWALHFNKPGQRVFLIPILLPSAGSGGLRDLGLGSLVAFPLSGNAKYQLRSDAEELARHIAAHLGYSQDDSGPPLLGLGRGPDSTRERWLRYLFAAYIGLLVASAAGGVKTFDMPGGVSAVVTVTSFASTFLISDCVHEYFGARTAKRFIWPGFWTLILAAAFFWLFVAIPAGNGFTHQDAYATVLQPPMGFVLAGLVAYLCSQWINIAIFGFLKRKHAKLVVWGSRNPISTLLSQAVDTVVFITLAYGLFRLVLPSGGLDPMPADGLLALVVGQYALKSLIAVSSWPLFLAVTQVLKKGELP
jgi:uncharacterized integral membrane protein (TIGR00697 family)